MVDRIRSIRDYSRLPIKLNVKETEIVSWLILNHLLLSKIAFRYDINDKISIRFILNNIQ